METHQTQQIPVPHQDDTQHRPHALQEMETDMDTNHPGPQATPRYKHKTARVSLSTSLSLSNHNLQTHTSKSKTQHSQTDTNHGNTPDATDSSTAPGRHTTQPTSITRFGNRHGYKPSRTASNTNVQTQNTQGQPLYFVVSLQSQFGRHISASQTQHSQYILQSMSTPSQPARHHWSHKSASLH